MTELHVVALSGGKDSTALALRLREVQSGPFCYVYTPTGNELPPMKAHLSRLSEMLGPLDIVSNEKDLSGLIVTQRAIPNWRQRWCTRILKIETYEKWLSKAVAVFDHVVSYVGIRADEPEREGGDY